MNKLFCRGCGCSIDTMDIKPFTPCTCSACGADLIIPLEMGGMLLEKPQQNQVFSSEKPLVLTPNTIDYISPAPACKLKEGSSREN